MSSESDDSGDDAYRGTRISRNRPRTNAMRQSVRANSSTDGKSSWNPAQMNLNASLPRSLDSMPTDRRDLGMWDEDAQPTIWDAVNYPREEEFEFESYFLRYDRQAEAKAIIDKPVNDTWQEAPTIHDEAYEEQEEPKSAFEEKIQEFFDGTHTRRNPLHRLNVADRLARLGEYSLLVIGTSDGRNLNAPLYEDEFDGLDDLNYLATFGQDRVESINIDTDMTSERFRLPETFDVITEDPDEDDDTADVPDAYMETIHWSRVIHIPEGTLEDDLRGTPALKPVFHELLNIDKIKAASGEGFWRAGYQGLLVQPPMDPRSGNSGRLEFSDDAEGVEQQIDEFLNNFERTIATPAEVTSLEGSVHNPKPHLEANYESIAAALDLPKSILTGEDRADTASSEDVRQWHQKVGERRNSFAEPVILNPLIERMVRFGLLPEPEGEGFVVEWSTLDEMTDMQQANLRSTQAGAISTLSGGNPTRIASIAELRQLFGWGGEIGSEVEEDELPSEGDLEVDEADLPDSHPHSSDESNQEQTNEDPQEQEGGDPRQQAPESGGGPDANFSTDGTADVPTGAERRAQKRENANAGVTRSNHGLKRENANWEPTKHPRTDSGEFAEKYGDGDIVLLDENDDELPTAYYVLDSDSESVTLKNPAGAQREFSPDELSKSLARPNPTPTSAREKLPSQPRAYTFRLTDSNADLTKRFVIDSVQGDMVVGYLQGRTTPETLKFRDEHLLADAHALNRSGTYYHDEYGLATYTGTQSSTTSEYEFESEHGETFMAKPTDEEMWKAYDYEMQQSPRIRRLDGFNDNQVRRIASTVEAINYANDTSIARIKNLPSYEEASAQHKMRSATILFNDEVTEAWLDEVHEKGQLAGSTLEHLAAHEMSHGLHHQLRDDDELPVMEFEDDDEDVAREVSEYATTNPVEFVAETSALILRGNDIPAAAWGMYEKYAGFPPSELTPIND